jgi:hypothetical protein
LVHIIKCYKFGLSNNILHNCVLIPLKQMLGAWGMLHVFIIPHVQTQSNRVCNSYVILLWLMLPVDHFVSRFLSLNLFLSISFAVSKIFHHHCFLYLGVMFRYVIQEIWFKTLYLYKCIWKRFFYDWWTEMHLKKNMKI